MPSPALIVHSTACIAPYPGIFDHLTTLPDNRFAYKLAPSVANDMPKNPAVCSFASSSIVPITPFNNEPGSSRDLIIFMMFFISSFETISVVIPDSKMFF